MARVTAYIPAYNHERFVGAAIESVLAQSFADFELLVCDDASTDGTLAVIESFSDPRVRVLKNGVNLGASWCARRCLDQAGGQFIAPLSSDDVWHPGKLQRQLDLLEARAELAAVFSQPRLIDEEGAAPDPLPQAYEGLFTAENRPRAAWLRYFFEQGNCLCLPSALVRASALEAAGGFNLCFEQLPDFDLWVRIATRGELHVMGEPLLDFRLHSDASNLSAPRAEIGARVTLETSQILRHFLQPEGLAALGINERTMAFARLEIARKAWEIGTDAHRLFAVEAVLGAELNRLPHDSAERFLAESRPWLAQVDGVWLGGRHKHSELKRKRRLDREKLRKLGSRFEEERGRRLRQRVARIFSRGRSRSEERAQPDRES